MAANSLKSIYKVKMREENTLSTRRASRGLERKKHRQDEVNKRRLVSDDMSPVMEDRSGHESSPRDHKPHKPVAHEKISTRLERLKQWREEKKRQTEQEKKGSKKPVFKVSPFKHVGESKLYKRTPAREVKPVWPAERAHRHQPSFSMSNSNRQPVKVAVVQTGIHKSAFDSVVLAERKSKSQPGPAAAATTRQHAAVQPAIAKPQPRTRQQTAVQPTIAKPQPRTRQHTAIQPARVESTKRQPRTRHRATVSQSAAWNEASIAKVQQTGNRADLASKLTVSAAAKAKANEGKAKAFLRANSRVTRTVAQNQTLDSRIHQESKKKEKHENLLAHEAVKADDHMDIVCGSEAEHGESSSDSKELHLSDSAVSTPKHSTPAPRRSVRGKKASADTTKNDVDGSKKRPSEVPAHSSSRDASAMDVERSDRHLADGQFLTGQASLEQEYASSLLQEVVSEQRSRRSAGIRHKKPRKVHMQDVGQYYCAEQGDTSVECTQTPVVNVLELSNKENVACPQSKSELLPVLNATPYRKHSHHWNITDQQLSQQDHQVTVHVPSSGRQKSRRLSQRLSAAASVEKSCSSSASAPGKRARSVSVAEPRVEVDVQTDSSNTQLPVGGSTAATSHSQVTSAVAKRKSVRIATLAFSSPADSQTEGEVVTIKYRKTPAVKRRKSTATNLPQVESPRATFVSVSDEGTSHLTGDKSVDQVGIMTATPPHTQHPTVSGSSVIDGTAVSCLDPSTAYQVTKPAEAQVSLRALQELSVHKCPGQDSFIEVPCDDSTDVAASTVSPSAPLITAAAAGDDVKFKDISSATPVAEEDNQSTQPFTPRSNDMSTSVGSSQRSSDENAELPVTPRSSRSRGLSMSGFKTPGQPTSAARSKKRCRRRHTEMSTQLKSPEEMIEILRKSPMIELTRRQSRRVQLSVAGVDALSASVGSLDVYIPTTEDTELIPSAHLLSAAAKDEAQVAGSRQLDASSGVQHFRELLLSERARLQQLCDAWAQISTSTPNLGEDVLGQIRSTIGKAQLLMEQRFQQFSGLVDNCQFGLGEKETTVTDLQGFWEMIYFQVEDVNQLFANLMELQHNQWHVKQTSPAKEARKRKAVKIRKPNVKSNFAAFREEVIKRKAQTVTKPLAEETSDTSKVFDAGFFQVTSPVRSLAGRKSQANSPLMPAAVDSSSEDKLSQDGHLSPESSKQHSPGPENTGNKENQLSGNAPENTGNKENQLSRNASSCMLPPLSAKRLSYLPAVPSPLLNDITGLLSKKS